VALLNNQQNQVDHLIQLRKATWTPPAQHYVDPLKEVRAYREAEQAGYMTKSQVIAATNGGDYDDIAAELAREQEIAKNLDITLDKDLKFEPVQQQLELDVGQVEETPKPTRKRRKK
jgi:capsid protein